MKQEAGNIQAILAGWQRPGRVYMLGTSALAGAVRAAETHTRRLYYAHSLIICAVILLVIIVVGFFGHTGWAL